MLVTNHVLLIGNFIYGLIYIYKDLLNLIKIIFGITSYYLKFYIFIILHKIVNAPCLYS